MNSRAALLAAIYFLSLTTSVSASGDDLLGLYAGGAVGEAHVRSTFVEDGYSLQFDQAHAGWKAFVGIRPISFVAIEVGYTDFGHATARFASFNTISDNSKQNAASVFAIGYLPLPVPFLDIYGKAGAARLHTEQQVSYGIVTPCPAKDFTCGAPITIGQDQWSTDFAYGAGVQAKMGSLAVRAEYERIDASGGNPDLFSLGVSWTF